MPFVLRDRTRRIREWLRGPVREARAGAEARPADLAIAAGIAIGVALLFVILNPVGSDRLEPPARLAYWLTVMLGGSAIGVALDRRLYRLRRFAARPVLGALASGLVLTPPILVLVVLANALAFGLPVDRPESWLGALPPVFGLSFGLSLVNAWAVMGRGAPAGDARPPDEPASASPSDEGEAAFRARLPDPFRTAELWALEAEDHYLRVHSSAGRTLILMRLSDAVAALARLDGAQTHRSWWVARSAARAIETNQGRAVLALPDGTKAPVSRSFYRELRSRGWL